MPDVPHLTGAERRTRLATRHLLAPRARAAQPEDAAAALVAVHATDPATSYLSLALRLREPALDAVGQALYDRGTLLRMHGMRRTVFVVPTAFAPVVQESTTRAVAVRERKGLVDFVASGGFDETWLGEVQEAAVRAVAEHGPLTATELTARVPGLAEQVTVAVGKPYEAKQAVASRVLRVLGMEGRLVRGRPRGSWTSGQYLWATGDGLAGPSRADAQAQLVGAWLAAYGPGTEADLKWWTGWSLTDVRKALAACGAQAVTVDGADGADGRPVPAFTATGDAEPEGEVEPWAAFLPALDATPMGWRERGWYLPGALTGDLFDRSGNVGPTVWWNGRVVGGWAQHADGDVVWRLLEPDGVDVEVDVDAVEAEAARLAAVLDGTRVTPRFRTPLERELAAGRGD